MRQSRKKTATRQAAAADISVYLLNACILNASDSRTMPETHFIGANP
jgi:hypothetical protein